MTIDEKISKLEEIEEKISDNKLSIADSMKLFEEGTKLSREILVELENTKSKITVIKRDMDAFCEQITSKEDIGNETK